jgi:transposase InsO family protein
VRPIRAFIFRAETCVELTRWIIRRQSNVPPDALPAAAGAYADQLTAIGTGPSKSRTGCYYDNAPMESFFHTLYLATWRAQSSRSSRAVSRLTAGYRATGRNNCQPRLDPPANSGSETWVLGQGSPLQRFTGDVHTLDLASRRLSAVTVMSLLRHADPRGGLNQADG